MRNRGINISKTVSHFARIVISAILSISVCCKLIITNLPFPFPAKEKLASKKKKKKKKTPYFFPTAANHSQDSLSNYYQYKSTNQLGPSGPLHDRARRRGATGPNRPLCPASSRCSLVLYSGGQFSSTRGSLDRSGGKLTCSTRRTKLGSVNNRFFFVVVFFLFCCCCCCCCCFLRSIFPSLSKIGNR